MSENEIRIGDSVAGKKVLEVGEIHCKVEGILNCDLCNKKQNELIAVKETGKGYCIKCFFDNKKKICKHGQDYLSIAFIKN